ncbi:MULTISPECIES: RAMP superfamily CRISPR-associated protein [unclassified Streptomyces]|uniref:RAMP superfamily CRISPR-associated protein n=1 Tax=unclassified Streptomyces TaxID=2593676 RepID=UPI001314F32B|nr:MULTISPECIES: RAMP superfamily CRISPR-associated protein [unclassified Streptomyces]
MNTESARTAPGAAQPPSGPPAGDRIRVHIAFHGPFRVGTGRAHEGADQTVNRADLIPASSVKGLLRASAAQLLPGRQDLLGAVFGTATTPTPWHWGPVRFTDTPQVVPRARVTLDPDTGAARDDHLLLGEEVWATTAEFTISRQGHVPADQLADHRTVLACAAAGVHTLGGDRRRGLGWVTCTPHPAIDEALLARFEELRAADTRD